eukprot:jgi/Tetstr1/430371/TSEL_020184.t1
MDQSVVTWDGGPRTPPTAQSEPREIWHWLPAEHGHTDYADHKAAKAAISSLPIKWRYLYASAGTKVYQCRHHVSCPARLRAAVNKATGKWELHFSNHVHTLALLDFRAPDSYKAVEKVSDQD